MTTYSSIAAAALIAPFAFAAGQNPPPAAPPPTEVSSSAGTIRIERLATLESPWGIAALPDGRVLVTEKPGRLRIWANGALSEPVQGTPTVVHLKTQGEQGGLMDVAVDPDFARNGYIYLSFSEAAEVQSPDLAETPDNRFGDFIDLTDNVLRGGAVARAKLTGNRLTELQVIWRQVPKTIGRGHFGNRLMFGPDGKLYITSGDRMRFDPAQSALSNLGKVVRINGDGSIPVDNPLNAKPNTRGDIYSLGHRNILAATFDGAGRLWVFEMGPLGGDEMNLVQPGRNYGWPIVSNGDNYAGPSIPDHPTKPEFQAPVRTWTPVIAPSGALHYTGAMFQPWRGSIIVGGLSSQSLIRLVMDGERVGTEERIYMGRRMRDVIQLADGSLLAIVDDKRGDLLRLSIR
ncbi:MAG TPA: PQQ-dependent sugar dehydrogenase [Gemmatimonadaceae bacterium]|nr:PQQ-dependent sugar dehydrogenase [Gemmatimonadaceae bacterium]